MRRTYFLLLAIFVVGGFTSQSVRADWPAKVFAPYINFNQITEAYNATGQKYFTACFCRANPTTGEPLIGNMPISAHYGLDQIEALRAKGGDVMIAFGGAQDEVAIAQPDVDKLAANYQLVIDAYKVTRIDLDVEGVTLYTPGVTHRRNAALAIVQKRTPGLRIDYTLSADPNTDFPDSHTDGLPVAALDLLRDAKAQGVKVDVCNVMTMDFGGRVDDMMKAGNTMGFMAKYSVTVAHTQLAAIDPDIKLGITPDLGVNDDPIEIFTVDDAKDVMEFTRHNDWITLLSFWMMNRDGIGGARRGGGGGAATRIGAATRAGRAGTRAGAASRAGRRGAGPTYTAPPGSFTRTFEPFTTGFTPVNQP